MTIETKYSPGDKVWVIFESRAQCLRIEGVMINTLDETFDESGKLHRNTNQSRVFLRRVFGEVMKMYTTESQTAKLIELGVEKPKSISGYYQQAPYKYDAETNTKMVVYDDTQYPIYAYSIGELIEMLPRCIESRGGDEAVLEISYDSQDFEWYCGHRWVYNSGWRCFNENYKTCDDKELIDALYRYIVALAEEGVI